MSLSDDAYQHLLAKAGGNNSAYVERLLRRDQVADSARRFADWYAKDPGLAEAEAAEASAAEQERGAA